LGLKIFPFHILNWFNLPFRSRGTVDPQTAVVVVRHS